MFRVKVLNKNNVITNQADFENLIEANNWIAFHQSAGQTVYCQGSFLNTSTNTFGADGANILSIQRIGN